MLKLIGIDGARFYSHMIKPGAMTVGRSKEADMVVNDKTVSREHAIIEMVGENGAVFVTDNGSRNGTTINGVVVTDRTEIHEGDVVMFGQVEFKVTSADQATSLISRPNTAKLSDIVPEKSVFLSLQEALKPLPSKVTDRPEVMTTLFEMSKILVLPEPKEVMLEKTLQLVSKVIPAERLAVLSTRENNEIETSAYLLTSGKDPGTFNLSNTIIQEILEEKSSILIDPKDDPRFASQESIILSEIKSAMATPLFDSGKVLGILYVDTTNPHHQYNDEYLRLLASFGNLIASRLLNYELLHERQEKQMFEAELKRASMIQRNLLLTNLPQIEGYDIHAFQEQCRMVGGDLYDVTTLPDGTVLFMVADVSGKGMGGALLMSNILASFRILYKESNFSLSKVVKQVSVQLFTYSAAEDFATLFIGLLDPKASKLTYINAGHNPPYLVRENGKLELLEPSGIMIGAFDFADWPESVVEFNEGDHLIVFTDGVVEADNNDQLYGEPRLENLLKEKAAADCKHLVDAIVDDVLRFVDDSPRSDDITMLAIKRNSNNV